MQPDNPSTPKTPFVNPNLQTLDELIDCEYGVVGTAARDEFEAGFDAFKTQLKPTPKKVH